MLFYFFLMFVDFFMIFFSPFFHQFYRFFLLMMVRHLFEILIIFFEFYHLFDIFITPIGNFYFIFLNFYYSFFSSSLSLSHLTQFFFLYYFLTISPVFSYVSLSFSYTPTIYILLSLSLLFTISRNTIK